MQVHYRVEVKDPKNHLVTVTMQLPKTAESIEIFLPSWSPGSYCMREYARHIRWFCARQGNGEVLFYQQVEKGTFVVDFSQSELKSPQGDGEEFSIEYDIYCHELTPRASHVDESHAFLHGPSYLMGVVGEQLPGPTIEFRFPALWSKLATGLEDISSERGTFLYQAADYDQLLDTPVEIGCHGSDGFMAEGIPHHINFYGLQYPHERNLKADMQKIVETVARTWGEVPYQQYVFITHLAPGRYGGLEHHNSSVLHFDGTQLHDREKYLAWLELVAHEHFHAWNVKRIRPVELSTFDYRRENYTRMHWLTEGLTSFMDGLLVLRSGLMTMEEYLKKLTRELNALSETPGRKFHSLEDSSFNAWIKLYHPDENSKNSSVSYYLKGGLVFLALQCMLVEKRQDITALLALLWQRYKRNPQQGVTAQEVYQMVESLAGRKCAEQFENYLTTTQEIDFTSHLTGIGLRAQWDEAADEKSYLGIEVRVEGEQVFVDKVVLDGPAYQAGLNAGDEILFVDGQRFLQRQWKDSTQTMRPGASHEILLSRLGRLIEAQVVCGRAPKKMKCIEITDQTRAQRALQPSPRELRNGA